MVQRHDISFNGLPCGLDDGEVVRFDGEGDDEDDVDDGGVDDDDDDDRGVGSSNVDVDIVQ